MIEAHIQKLRARDRVSREEEDAIRGLIGSVIEVPADKTLVRHGEQLNQSLLLISGWLARAKDLLGQAITGLNAFK